ncbi:hypothetical protein CSB95_2671 [Pseudomonas aeruginosa]|nr:hypothetical protein CSC29_3110 [Pseudomonas aeruginosa]PRW08576.1 hypothetical protein CSB95_2671 [Pseudomonas aeruginosa]
MDDLAGLPLLDSFTVSLGGRNQSLGGTDKGEFSHGLPSPGTKLYRA